MKTIKHFMDIQAIREEDTELKQSNCVGFNVGDIISITEKFDGSNAQATWDDEENCMVAFSRKKLLNWNETLNGFYNYIQNLPGSTKDVFKKYPSWRIFGEWTNHNKIHYDFKEKHWLVYDIYDTETEKWMPQNVVKTFAKEANLEYIHVLYEGEFISWEHCRSFMNSPAYGERQEGIVVKNQTNLNCPNERVPFYLKIVNDDFKESMSTKIKIVDPEVEANKKNAEELVNSIVTKARIEKMLFKLRDENLLPDKLTPEDMKTVARVLPKAIYDDCMKEEKEIVIACGEYFSKMCSSTTMMIARNIICG